MIHQPIIYPVLILILFTFVNVILALFARVHALREGHLNHKHFSLMNFAPEHSAFVTKTSRNMNNLFQLPLLFYINCIIIVLCNFQASYLIYLAWFYVGFRILNSIIHVTYNNFIHRMLTFTVSNTLVITMTIMLLVESTKR